jgi:hypothetical protein
MIHVLICALIFSCCVGIGALCCGALTLSGWYDAGKYGSKAND